MPYNSEVQKAIDELQDRNNSVGSVSNFVRDAVPKVTEGRKDDQNKIRLELIPPSLLLAIGTILTFGAQKYSARNWEKGIAWGRVFGALMRHLWAWWNGERCDAETGKSHLWHAGCCLTFLIEYESTHPELDDRPYKKEAV